MPTVKINLLKLFRENISVYYYHVLRGQNGKFLNVHSTRGLYTYRCALNGEKQEYSRARSRAIVTRQTNRQIMKALGSILGRITGNPE
jgi:hypothetical protein